MEVVMKKISKKGKEFLSEIKSLEIPVRKFSEEIGRVFLSQDDTRNKIGHLYSVLRTYRPNCHYRIGKLRNKIISHYRSAIPVDLIRSDGRLKNNALRLVSDEEILFLINYLESVETLNSKLMESYWSFFWKAYIEEEKKNKNR